MNGNVLVVEDDSQLNQLVGAYVELAGYTYRSALDGNSALRSAHEQPPDLVILDVMLPDIDGFEVCRQLKNAPDTAPIPIVMLTALCQADNRRKGLECGATAYMTKPFDPDELMSAIRKNANHQTG